MFVVVSFFNIQDMERYYTGAQKPSNVRAYAAQGWLSATGSSQ